VTGVFRKLHNEELHNFSTSIFRMIKPRRMIFAGHVARMGEKRNAYTSILVGMPAGKRQLGRRRRRLVENIEMDLRGTRGDGMVWTGSIWLRIGTIGGLLLTR
jgi:hypothetical protein